MENISTRTWTAIGVAGLLLFLSYFARLGVQREAWAPASAGFSYEMPRPQNYEPGFDLSDREVERDFTKLPGLPALKKAADKAKAKADPKKAEADKKAVAAKKAAAAKARAAALAAAKRRMKVDVVNTNRPGTLTASVTPDAAANTGFYGDAAAPAAENAKNAADKKDEEEPELTASQWRSLLQSSPTSENVAKFLKAKHEGKIDSASYYQIVHDLLVDSAADRRRAALAILDQDASPKTFEFLVTTLASAPADAKLQIQKAISNYAQPAKMPVLMRVLGSSKEASVLQSAATQLTSAFTEFKKVYTSGENQNRRLAGGFSLQQFLAMVPSLKRLGGSSSPVASQLTQLASDIESLKSSNGDAHSRLALPGGEY